MHRVRTRRPSPALIVAFVALVAALSGTGYAAVSHSAAKRKHHHAKPLTRTQVKKIVAQYVRTHRKQFAGPAGAPGAAGAAGAQGPPGPSTSGYAEQTFTTALDGTGPTVVSLGQTVNAQAPSTGLITVAGPSRLIGNAAMDITATAGGDVWCWLQYASAGGSYADMSTAPAELDVVPTVFALPVTGRADVGAGTYDVRVRCAKTGTTANATHAQLTVVATGR